MGLKRLGHILAAAVVLGGMAASAHAVGRVVCLFDCSKENKDAFDTMREGLYKNAKGAPDGYQFVVNLINYDYDTTLRSEFWFIGASDSNLREFADFLRGVHANPTALRTPKRIVISGEDTVSSVYMPWIWRDTLADKRTLSVSLFTSVPMEEEVVEKITALNLTTKVPINVAYYWNEDAKGKALMEKLATKNGGKFLYVAKDKDKKTGTGTTSTTGTTTTSGTGTGTGTGTGSSKPPEKVAASRPASSQPADTQPTAPSGPALTQLPVSFMGVSGRGSKIVYILDTTASVGEAGLTRQREALVDSLSTLMPQQKFAVVLCGGNQSAIVGQKTLLGATQENVSTVSATLEKTKTEGENKKRVVPFVEAFKAAFALSPDTIFFVSDDPFDGAVLTTVERLNRPPVVPIHTIALEPKDPTTADQLKGLAKTYNGTSRVIEAKKK